MCDVRGQEVRSYSIMLLLRFGRGLVVLFIFAQMFCLRNGVMTGREREERTSHRSSRTVL